MVILWTQTNKQKSDSRGAVLTTHMQPLAIFVHTLTKGAVLTLQKREREREGNKNPAKWILSFAEYVEPEENSKQALLHFV